MFDVVLPHPSLLLSAFSEDDFFSDSHINICMGLHQHLLKINSSKTSLRGSLAHYQHVRPFLVLYMEYHLHSLTMINIRGGGGGNLLKSNTFIHQRHIKIVNSDAKMFELLIFFLKNIKHIKQHN